ncbi:MULTISPECIES: hypothetical protein [unclassified Leptolyngbya]|uniref:hypothetical protein n=1 Tax=unclassified Leptolyngbya TaxID=2650499 RepID=UPI0016862658|nr:MULTISPECIES: hypothetical protein [unclassified Leptolyngbya]MBD1911864.1 hypothetical protein [Leptolyngbya sp. FACHB-8]MBD2156073.1 hypothetical protein [Leptolyngbya sp. FACHB-16]
MSHEVNTQKPILDPSAMAVVDPLQAQFLEPIPEADTVMDESADAVMDDVFEDVERILREGSLPHDVAPPPPPKPSNPLSSLANNLIPSLLVAKPAPPEETAIQELEDLDVDDLAAIATEGGDLATLEPSTAEPKVTQKSFDQLLLTLASISVLLTGGLWLVAQIFWKESPRVVSTTPVQAAATATVSEGDREFLTYMSRSLDVINRKADLAKENATVASNSPSALPDVAVAGGNTTPTPPTVLDRVYVPVYQNPPGNSPAAVTPSVSPPPQRVTVAPIAPTAPTAPVAAPSVVAAAPTAPSPSSSAVPNIAGAPSHSLVGVLNLGDRSAALFTINGTTQRIGLGEMIGTSGWSLVSVNGQEAIIRRNGEVRSVYTGQQF